jgi:hypothetical protein
MEAKTWRIKAMTFQVLNPDQIKAQGLKKTRSPKPKGYAVSNFDAALGAVSAMAPVATTTGQMYGTANSGAVLAAAFGGINELGAHRGGFGGYAGASYGGGAPYLAAGMGGQYASTGGSIGTLDPNAPVVPGTEGFSQMDMINTMNQNNLQLLELQAVMQSNMQGWNTKSNILSADHRARMAMIEKFTARG